VLFETGVAKVTSEVTKRKTPVRPTETNVASKIFSRALARAYPGGTIVGAKLSNSSLEKGLYKARVIVQLRPAKTSKKLTASTFYVEIDSLKHELVLYKCGRKQGKAVPVRFAGPWDPPDKHGVQRLIEHIEQQLKT
jgi:rRNA maturation protein Nop10